MEVHGHVHVLEVSLSRRVAELPVVPVHHGDAIRLALRKVIGEIVSDSKKTQYLGNFHTLTQKNKLITAFLVGLYCRNSKHKSMIKSYLVHSKGGILRTGGRWYWYTSSKTLSSKDIKSSSSVSESPLRAAVI